MGKQGEPYAYVSIVTYRPPTPFDDAYCNVLLLAH